MQESLRTDSLLVRVLLVLMCVLLALLCAAVWRLTALVDRADRTLAAISEDVKQTASTTARISRHVDRLEESARQALPISEAESLLDAAAAVRGPAEGGLAPAAEEEIRHLLSCLRRPELRFEYSGGQHSAGRFYLQLCAKCQTYRRTLASAEDFIARVATQTITGHPYYVVQDGEKRPLDAWLRAELEKHRSEKAAE
jgi:hypothetical protein